MSDLIYKETKINLFYITEALLSAFAPIFILLGYSPMASLLFNFSFIVILSHLIFLIIIKKIPQEKFDIAIILFLMLALVLFNVAINSKNGFGFTYLTKAIIFCATMIFVFISSIDILNKKTKEWICVVYCGLSIFYIIFYFLFGGNEIIVANSVSMGFNNPNEAGMWLMTCSFWLVLLFDTVKKKRQKALIFICILLLLYMSYSTGSRNVLLAFILMICIKVFYKSKKRKMLPVILLLPIIYAIVYLFLVKTNLINYFIFLSSAGKPVTSRVEIWNFALNSIQGVKFFTGNYYGISSGTGMSQMHNMLIDVLASYGIFVFVLFIIYFIKMIKGTCCDNKRKGFNIGTVCFLGAWFMGFNEAGFITGSLGIYIVSCFFLTIGFSNIEK